MLERPPRLLCPDLLLQASQLPSAVIRTHDRCSHETADRQGVRREQAELQNAATAVVRAVLSERTVYHATYWCYCAILHRLLLVTIQKGWAAANVSWLLCTVNRKTRSSNPPTPAWQAVVYPLGHVLPRLQLQVAFFLLSGWSSVQALRSNTLLLPASLQCLHQPSPVSAPAPHDHARHDSVTPE